jgi:ribosomal protein S18 acetylase RimI-like enzyme
MKLQLINESNNSHYKIDVWDEYSDDYDPWLALDQAEKIASDAGIRISRDKEINFIALVDDNVVGATWKSITYDEDQLIYDFDVAVSKEHRSYNIGIDLIRNSISEFRSISHYDSKIRVWVINPKLVNVLERRFGFEISSKYSDGSAHMEYYS